MSFQTVNFDHFKEMIHSKESILIDVREDYEFDNFNIGGINIPMAQIKSRLDDFNNYSTILFCCKSGKRSNAIGFHLKDILTNHKIYSLIGGLEGLAKKN